MKFYLNNYQFIIYKNILEIFNEKTNYRFMTTIIICFYKKSNGIILAKKRGKDEQSNRYSKREDKRC